MQAKVSEERKKQKRVCQKNYGEKGVGSGEDAC